MKTYVEFLKENDMSFDHEDMNDDMDSFEVPVDFMDEEGESRMVTVKGYKENGECMIQSVLDEESGEELMDDLDEETLEDIKAKVEIELSSDDDSDDEMDEDEPSYGSDEEMPSEDEEMDPRRQSYQYM